MLVDQVREFSALVDTPSVLAGWQDRLECGELTVPLDYRDPAAGTLTLAVSRLLPTRTSQGVVVTNPGGPGVEGRTLPAVIADSGMAALAEDRTIVGIDVRGTGGSTTLHCPELIDVQAPEVDTVSEEVALSYSADVAAANAACAESDGPLLASLTTQNAARDLDLVRSALGEDTIDYYGTSWGTELGMAYLSAFPDRVGRMLLDSVTDPRQDAEAALDDIAAAVATFGEPDPEQPDGTTADIGYRPIDFTARTAFTCNAYTGADDPRTVWSSHEARSARFGLDPQERIAHPLSGDLPGTSVCAGWPFAPEPVAPEAGGHDGLQIVAHATETTTPAVWAERAHQSLGGSLLTLPDGAHGSLSSSSAAPAAVAFLRDGTPMR